MAKMQFNTPQSQAKLQKVLQILQTPMSRNGLEKELYACKDTCNMYLKHLKGQGLIYVQRWEVDDYGHRLAVYAAGNFPDKPRPKAIPIKELNRRQWKKIERNPKLKAQYAEVRNRNQRLKNIKPFADPMLQWMRV